MRITLAGGLVPGHFAAHVLVLVFQTPIWPKLGAVMQEVVTAPQNRLGLVGSWAMASQCAVAVPGTCAHVVPPFVVW